jgi:hypothetical protein
VDALLRCLQHQMCALSCSDCLCQFVISSYTTGCCHAELGWNILHVTVLDYSSLLVEAVDNKVYMEQECDGIAACCTSLMHLQSAVDSPAIGIRSNCMTAVWQIVWHALRLHKATMQINKQ